MVGGAAPASFQRLGLLPDAEARDIRRAYARELKKIDQALDAAGFQQLRGAYEAALQFAQWQADDDEPAQEAANPVSPGEVARMEAPEASLPAVSPDDLADMVTEAFRGVLAALAVKHGGPSDAPYEAALREALADERLFGIEARHGFELRVAVLLVQGWRPGHEALLVAAVAVFDWSAGARLASLGQPGAILDRAVEERAIFDSQGMADKQVQMRILRLLRQQQLPDPAKMAQDIPVFMRMHTRFPHWLPIVAPAERIAYWRKLPLEPGAPAPEPSRKTSWALRLVAGCLCLFAVLKGGDLLHRSPGRSPVSMAANPRLSASDGAPVDQARIDEMTARIVYNPRGAAASLQRQIEFDVFLNPEGKAVGANLIRASGDATLDAAVRAAIMDSAPFPPDTKKVFSFVFTYKPPAPDMRKGL
jgi:hypothetical protein